MRRDVSRLQKDMAHLRIRAEIAPIRQDLTPLRADFARLCYELSYFATKADLHRVAARIKGWMMGGAMAMVTVNFAMYVFNFHEEEAANIAVMRAQVASLPVTRAQAPSAPAPAVR